MSAPKKTGSTWTIKNLKYTFPKLPPYKSTGDYITSKQRLNEGVFKHEGNKPEDDPACQLFAAQRNLVQITDKLSARRKLAEEQYKVINKQWHDIAESEGHLKGTFKEMNKFIQENEAKKQRARKWIEDRKLAQKWEVEVQALKDKNCLILEAQDEFNSDVADLGLYGQFLNSVVTENTEFKNADDLINRYEALLDTKLSLAERQDATLSLLETARVRMAKIMEEYDFRILGLSNKVAELNSRYNVAFREALQWEALVLKVRKCIFHRYEDLGQVKQNCWNIYFLMCTRKGEVAKINKEDLEHQLIYIKQTLRELNKVKQMVKPLSKD